MSGWQRVWAWLLLPFDVNGPDGKPAHAKVLSTIAFFCGLVLVAFFTAIIAYVWVTTQKAPPAHVFGFLLSFAFLVYVTPYGLDGLKTFSKSKWANAAAASFRGAPSEEGRERPAPEDG